MSEEVKTPEQGSEDTRVKINPKDAATSMLPAGLDANNLTPEQQMNYTSTMVKASRLHEKAIDGLSKEEEDVFNALLIATPDDIPVEDRFAQAQQLFNTTVKKVEKKEEQPEEGTKVSPKGEADVSSKVAINNSNLLEETNPAPYGDDNEYFKFLEDRYKKQTTVKRLQNNN
jgi:hypothetical protein|tara:strand:- start:3498 stop:4013 length:516 start_codon:yes stop_codon:yes gene_type:complete